MHTKSKVLIIDDDVNICELIRLYLENEGYNVLPVYNGIKGLDAFKDFTPNLWY